MLSTLLALLSLAHADEISSGNFYPGASAAEAGAASVGATVTGVTIGSFVSGGVGVDASWAPTDRLGLRVVSHGTGGLTDTGADGGAAGLVGARFLVVDQPFLRLAPFAALAFATTTETSTVLLPGVGLAVEAGGERVWFDGSMPVVVGLATDEFAEVIPLYVAPALAEAGVNVRIGERSTLRVGTASLSLNARYRYEADRWYGGVGVTGVVIPGFEPITAAGASLEGGARF